MVPQVAARTCVMLTIVTLAISLSGCLTEQPANETQHPTIDPVNVTHTHYYVYNGTPYLTGIIKNVGTQNLVDLSLQAEGYVNNTTIERGYAGPETGVNSIIPPGGNAPFMIKMSSVTASGSSTTTLNRTPIASAIKTATSKRTIRSNSSKNQTSNAQQAESYKILPPNYTLSNGNPYPLTIVNNKTYVLNQTIRGVNGEVYNGGTENVNSAVVAVALYGKDGNVLGVFAGKPQGTWGPTQTAPFEINFPTSFSISLANIARIELYVYEFSS